MNLPIAIPAAADLNEYTTPGMYFCSENGLTVQNTPDSADSFSLFVERTGAWGTGIKQTFTHFANGWTYQRVLYYDAPGSIGSWVLIATATPPQVYDLSLTGATGTCKYSLDQFGLVRITGLITRDDGTTYFGTLPEGYRPAAQVVFAGCGFTDGSEIFPCTAGVDPDGRVWINDFGSGFTKVPVNMYFYL